MLKSILGWFGRHTTKYVFKKCKRCQIDFTQKQLKEGQQIDIWAIYCHNCKVLCDNGDRLKFVYSGSDHWHSANKLYLVVCTYSKNSRVWETSYIIYSRSSTNSGWNNIGTRDNLIDAILAANSHHIMTKNSLVRK